MIVIAIFGFVVNTIASYVTREGNSLNQRSVNLHMLEDVLGWIVVLLGSILMKLTHILWIDSLLSIGVAIFILFHASKNLKSILDIFLEVTPENMDIDHIKAHILEIEGVLDVHHIHIRSMDGYNHYATLHVVVKEYTPEVKSAVRQELEEHGVAHSTIELELADEHCQNDECSLEGMKKPIHHHHHE